MSVTERIRSAGLPRSVGRSVPAGGYLLDNARAEAAERFVWLAELFDGVTRGRFARLSVGAGSPCWGVRAGGPGIPEALAAMVGPTGQRTAIVRSGDRARLWTRKRYEITDRFPDIVTAATR